VTPAITCGATPTLSALDLNLHAHLNELSGSSSSSQEFLPITSKDIKTKRCHLSSWKEIDPEKGSVETGVCQLKFSGSLHDGSFLTRYSGRFLVARNIEWLWSTGGSLLIIYIARDGTCNILGTKTSVLVLKNVVYRADGWLRSLET